MKESIKEKRVNLRKLKISDAKVILENAKNKEITKYTFVIPPPFKLDRVKDFIKKTQKEMEKRAAFEFGIELKEAEKLIGTINLSGVDHKNKNANVGFWLAKKYWGKGLAKEALDLILNFGFKKLKLERIQARVFHKNKPTQKLLEKVGFKLEGRLRKSTFFKNKWYDNLIFGILKKE